MSEVKVYKGQRVSVQFDATRCIHSAECVRGLPAVFDPLVSREPGAPLHLDLRIAQLDSAEQAGLLRALRLQGEGSNQAHRLTASADIAGQHHLAWRAEGGWDAARAT